MTILTDDKQSNPALNDVEEYYNKKKADALPTDRYICIIFYFLFFLFFGQ